MEKLISIDADGRMVLPKAIREAVNLRKGEMARVRLVPGRIIQIEPLRARGRRLKKVGKFLVAVGDGTNSSMPRRMCGRSVIRDRSHLTNRF